MCSDRTLIYTSDGVIARGLCIVRGTGRIVLLSGVCLLCVGRVLISEWGNLATARGWRWRLPRDKWWPLAVTGGTGQFGV